MGKNLVAKDNVQLVMQTKEKGYSDLIVLSIHFGEPYYCCTGSLQYYWPLDMGNILRCAYAIFY